MLKKSVFTTQSFNAEVASATVSDSLTKPDAVVVISPPANMKATRVTVQLIGASDGTKQGYIVISSQAPINGLDGYILFNGTDTTSGLVTPVSFTFESFNEEGWSQTIYIAAINVISGQPANVCVIFEGFEK